MNDQEACHAICQEHKKLKVDLNEMLTDFHFLSRKQQLLDLSKNSFSSSSRYL
jgi:hypothetical protein